MKKPENYSDTMTEEVLHLWAKDAQEYIEYLETEVDIRQNAIADILASMDSYSAALIKRNLYNKKV